MSKRYVLCPGPVVSRSDGDEHFVGSSALARLYGVRLGDCHVMPYQLTAMADIRARALRARADLIWLYPRYSGDYTLPAA